MGAALPARCFEGICGRNATNIPASLRESAIESFAQVYGGKRPEFLGIAPGRAEVLGNHTDYNEGFILAAAIDRYVVIAGRRTEDQGCRVASEHFPNVVVHFSATHPQKQTGKQEWANYVVGVVSELGKLGAAVGGFDAFVTSNLPVGAGVSSSAAVEMATAKLLARLFPNTVGRLDELTLIKAAKAAENNFVGMGCGILDQFSSGRGKAGHLMFLDCRSLDFDHAPFKGGQFVLANTNAPHQLVDGKYAEMRAHCFAAAKTLQKATGDSKITHLRDVVSAVLEEHASKLSEGERRRAKHIVYENERVHTGMAALKSNDLPMLGHMISLSHQSSRDDFGNSCKELDLMVDCAQGIEGFLGARLMGGGFGGATINLVKDGYADSFAAELARRYEAQSGIKPTVLVCRPSDGAFSEAVQ